MRPGGAVRAASERHKVIALDTNIFIYHFEENPACAAFTDNLFEKIESGRLRAVTSVLTLHQILVREISVTLPRRSGGQGPSS